MATEHEIDEILDLQPLSRTRVNAQVRRYNEPARLEIVEEGGEEMPPSLNWLIYLIVFIVLLVILLKVLGLAI